MFRKSANLTREKLAAKAPISTHYLGEIERGKASPSLSVIQDLANALGVKVKDLFHFPSEQGTPKEIAEEIVAKLQAGDVSDVEALILIRDMVEMMSAERAR